MKTIHKLLVQKVQPVIGPEDSWKYRSQMERNYDVETIDGPGDVDDVEINEKQNCTHFIH